MVRISAIAASLAAVGASAFVPTTMPPAYLQSRAVSAPPLRMQFGDMFKKAFENNPNIPSAPAVGPGSPGFSKTMPQKPQKNSAEDSSVAVAPPPVAPPPAAVWQQATDPASGNPYWYNAETGESSWTPPTPAAPPPAPPPAPASQDFDENAVIQLDTAKIDRRRQAMMEAAEEEDEKTKLERDLNKLNKWLVAGIIDQEEWNEQAAAIKAKMPAEPVVDAAQLQRPFKTTTMKWGALIDTKIPNGWVENRDYERQSKLEPGSLVAVQRSDGSIKFAQVVEKSGFFYEDFWKVVVSMKDDGSPGATRVEEGVMLARPTPSGLAPVLENMPDITVNEQDISEQLKRKNDKGFFGNMFAAPVYEGGSAPTEVAAAPPPKAAAPTKAVVPAGIIPPKATVPAGVIPQAQPPSGVVPTSTTTLGVDVAEPETSSQPAPAQNDGQTQSEWI